MNILHKSDKIFFIFKMHNEKRIRSAPLQGKYETVVISL